MTTAIKTVKRALNMLGVHSEVNPADPELLEIGREYLLDLVQGLEVDQVELGTTDVPFVDPVTQATDMNEREGAFRGIVAMLADRMAPLCRVPISAETRREMRLGKRDLYQRFQNSTVPSIVPSKLLPRGQGSSRGGFSQTFFDGESLAADTNS